MQKLENMGPRLSNFISRPSLKVETSIPPAAWINEFIQDIWEKDGWEFTVAGDVSIYKNLIIQFTWCWNRPSMHCQNHGHRWSTSARACEVDPLAFCPRNESQLVHFHSIMEVANEYRHPYDGTELNCSCLVSLVAFIQKDWNRKISSVRKGY